MVMSVAMLCGAAGAETVFLGALKDNTLYQNATGAVSNGKGDHFFAGVTDMGSIRRALIAFDIAAAVPHGATVTGVELRLNMSMSTAAGELQFLHRVLADWGEGSSDAPMGEGGGTAATPGDATWLHTFWPDQYWDLDRRGKPLPGGLYVPQSSAEQTVVSVGYYYWSSRGMVADVQQWLDDASTNFGWLIRGLETGGGSTKRYDSKDIEIPDLVPRLTIHYEPAPPCPADLNDSGAVDGYDLALLLGGWTGASAVDPCDPPPDADLDRDCAVNGYDLALLLGDWGRCPE
jgi:hypothetical protein